ncbi:MAG: aminoacyl-tRNA hydrolase, partial [Ignavibacteria bacterium]
FIVIDKLAEFFKIESFEFEDNYLYAVSQYKEKQVVLLKPLTYMNASGLAVREFYDKYDIEAGNMLIVYDDVNLDFGVLRLRPSGTDGGQNGIKSVIYEMGTDEIPRLRIGIRHKEEFQKIENDPDYSLADYVLSEFGDNELKYLDKVADSAGSAIVSFIDDGIAEAMNKFNKDHLLPVQ